MQDEASALISTLADNLIAGRMTAVLTMLDADLAAKLDADDVARVWRETLDAHGPIVGLDPPTFEAPRADGSQVATMVVRCQREPFQLRATVDAARHVTSLHLQPVIEPNSDPWMAPDYVAPANFTETDTTIGPVGLAVPATLCLPNCDTAVPGVVLVQGSGPTDRDSTVGPNKPLRDLAWGLATRGIASVRFDKVTRSHPTAVANAVDFTVEDEYLTHATAAIGLLGSHSAIDKHQIFVLGHSQGASIAPRIADLHSDLAGLVCLAAGAQPIHHAAIRQLRYLVSLEAAPNPTLVEALTTLTRQAKNLDDESSCESTPSSELPFGIPMAYWSDLHAHDTLAIAARLELPMLFLQGGRDYQVTVLDDLDAWKTALASHPNAQFRVYPSGDHFFFTGTQPSTPTGYREPQHVDVQVINDVADWIDRVASTVPLDGSTD